MLISAVSSGVVFGLYFTTYNQIGIENPLAGPISSLVTSFVKIPISNSIRLVQVNKAGNMLRAARKIVRTQGVKGLYKGYGLSLVEDMIEFDMRARLYNTLRMEDNVSANLAFGAFVGMLSSYVTTPFDTIRANMSVHRKTTMHAIHDIYKKNGVTGFYKGATFRMYSNGIKYGMFFMFFELLNPRKTCDQSRS